MNSSLRLTVVGLAVLLAGNLPAFAQAIPPQEFSALLQSLAPVAQGRALAGPSAPAEAPRISMTANGYVRCLGAPPGQHFVPTNGLVTGQPATVARNFLREHGRLFGIQSAAVDFTTKRERQSGGRNYLRLQQLYQSLPIIAAETVVQVDASGGVESVLTDIETDTTQLDSAILPLSPTVSSEAAVTAVKKAFAAGAAGALVQTTPPVLSLFAPAVLDETGPQQLVWDMIVFTDDRNTVNERVLWDAVNGNAVRVWTQRHSALNRQVSDGNNSTSTPTVVRIEGQGPSNIADADNIYTFLGDTYNYYLTWYGRDSYNNVGAILTALSRYCQSVTNCPWANANSGPPMRFGAGWAADDIVAHEYTHNVTASESQLIYTNVSGAINESFSDVWGEFVDLSNSGGTDTAAVRWQMGEDIATGAIRSMSFPGATNINSNFNNPDRLSSPLYQQPSNTTDNGGVHNNSGVNNKLCYLLTDGDTFNGQTIYGNNMNAVAYLYYEVQANLLTSGAGWTELYNALTQAAVNLGWGVTDRNNLYRACLAVEIATNGRNLYVDKTSVCPLPTGIPACLVFEGPYHTIGQGVAGANPGDVLRVRAGSYNEPMTIQKIVTIRAENGPVTIGQ